MPITKPGTAPGIKRVTRATSTGEASKESLQDRLVLVTVREFDPEFLGTYGTTPRAVVDVVDVESGENHRGLWVFSNLAKQLAAGLKPGETGLGRIVTGPTRNGTGQWWGFEFSESDDEYARAEQVVAPF